MAPKKNINKKHKPLLPKRRKAPKANNKIKKKKGYAPGLLGSIGHTIGSYIAPGVGGAFGKKAGDWLGKITGMGDYKVSSNSLVTSSPPAFGGGAITICHREFIKDVSTSVDFVNNVQRLNPGNSELFPFLSNLASHFEEYQFLGLVFEFKTTSATAIGSTNTALGSIIMATNYDVLDAPFSSKREMDAYEFAVTTVPCNSMLHPVECAPGRNVLKNMYVSSAVPVGADPRFYDQGLFQVASSGSQAIAVAGELWVSYHVKLSKPKLGVDSLSTSGKFDCYYTGVLPTPLPVGTLPPTLGQPNNQNPMTGAVLAPNSNLGTSLSTITGGRGKLTFPSAGSYLVVMTGMHGFGQYDFPFLYEGGSAHIDDYYGDDDGNSQFSNSEVSLTTSPGTAQFIAQCCVHIPDATTSFIYFPYAISSFSGGCGTLMVVPIHRLPLEATPSARRLFDPALQALINDMLTLRVKEVLSENEEKHQVISYPPTPQIPNQPTGSWFKKQ